MAKSATRPLAPNHRIVFETLREARKPLTAYEVLDAVKDKGVSAPPTVYRALDRLLEEGLAHRLATRGTFVACQDPEACGEDRILLSCSACGGIEEIHDQTTHASLIAKAERADFAIARASIELIGTCRDCQAAS